MNSDDKNKISILKGEIGMLKEAQKAKEEEIMKVMAKAPIDDNLLFFYGKGCSFTGKVEPAVNELEIKLGKRLKRLETWYDEDSQKRYEEVGGPQNCGGVPYFYNQQTKESVCGARSFDLLHAWASAKK